MAVCLPRGADELLTMLATLKAGATYVPIDAGHPAERIHMILEDAGPEVLVTHRGAAFRSSAASRILDRPGCCSTRLGGERRPGRYRDRARWTAIAWPTFFSPRARPGGPRGSRSGGAPSPTSCARWPTRRGWPKDDRLLAITTTTFDISGLELFLPLCVGATVDIADRETAQDPRLLRQRLEARSITVLQATPATWRLLIEAGWQAAVRCKMLCGGEALSAGPRRAVARARDRAVEHVRPDRDHGLVGDQADRARLRASSRSAAPSTTPRSTSSTNPCGLVPAGIVGEIVIGGEGLARGYRGRPDLTAESSSPDLPTRLASASIAPAISAAALDDGDIECLGRVDHQVKIRGFRIELGEIETVLRAVPGVREVLVMAALGRSR